MKVLGFLMTMPVFLFVQEGLHKNGIDGFILVISISILIVMLYNIGNYLLAK